MEHDGDILDEFSHSSHSHLDRDLLIHTNIPPSQIPETIPRDLTYHSPMQIVKIDMIGTESLERFFTRLFHIRWVTTDTELGRFELNHCQSTARTEIHSSTYFGI